MKTDAFALRHTREDDVAHVKDNYAATLDQLIDETIPSDIRLKSDLDLEPAMTEYEFANHIKNWEIKIKFSNLTLV
jgi:glycine dehydrogenase